MPAWIVPAAIAAGSWLLNTIGQRAADKRTARSNAELAKFQADANERYLSQQLEYNSPKSQMMRYGQAGLNPNLVYGQGNPGNQAAPLASPEIGRVQYSNSLGNLSATYNQSVLTASQVQATDARTRQTFVLTQLNELQKQVMEKNPLLNESGYRAIIDSLKSAAEIKGAESKLKGIQSEWADLRDVHSGLKMGQERLFKEMDLLDQRFKLGQLDAKLKAEVLSSKEFQNAILEVQKRWMVDADITPQHILQFIQLLLMKSL